MDFDGEELEIVAKTAELRRQNEALKRAKGLREAYGINFYVPHFKQDKFHSAGDKTGRYCRTGNRGGKTKCGAAEDVAWCLGGRVWYRNSFAVLDGNKELVRDHVGTRNHPLVTKGIPSFPVKILLLVQDWEKANEIFTNNEGSYETWGDLFQLIPTEALGKIHKSRGGHIDRINIKRLTEFGGGESVIVLDTVESYKHAKMSAESGDFDAIHVDEPCPRGMFVAHKRGLVDRNGKFWINCTPLDEMWINDEFVPPGLHAVADAPDGLEFNKMESGGGSRFMITWSIQDNPHNTPEAIEEFAAGLTREEKACRLEGLPLAFAGLVYKEFVYDLHVLCDIPNGWKDYHLPPQDYTIRLAWDVHQRIPQAILLAATAPNGDVFVYDEQFFDSLIKPNAELLKEKLNGKNVTDQWIDPFAVIPSAVTGESVLDELGEYDLYFDKASKDLSTGISKVRERLMERRPGGKDPSTGELIQAPTIYFSPKLKETLFEFTHYVFDSDKNKPKDRDDHMMENLYRLVLGGLDYVKPPSGAPSNKPLVIRDGVDLSMMKTKSNKLQPSFYK